MSQSVLESVFSTKTNIVESFFEMFNGQSSVNLSSENISWLLGQAKSSMNSDLFQLFSKITGIESVGDQVTMTIGKSVSAGIQIGGMPINLVTGEKITAKIHPSTLSLTQIKGLSAGMGLMKIDLQGVQFKKDGQSFLVNLDTPMKTFSIKIPVL